MGKAYIIKQERENQRRHPTSTKQTWGLVPGNVISVKEVPCKGNNTENWTNSREVSYSTLQDILYEKQKEDGQVRKHL